MRRLRLLGFVLRSVPAIVRESGGLMEAIHRVSRDMSASGFRFAFGELISAAACARRRDTALYGSCEKTDAAMTPAEVNAWFASRGLAVQVLARAPVVFAEGWTSLVESRFNAGADAVYADYLAPDGIPAFLPDLGADLVPGHCPFIAIRNDLVAGVEEGASAMRTACEKVSRVDHIPMVLARLDAEAPPDAGWESAARPSVSVVIPSRDNLALLKACVNSIRRAEALELEIIVVDHCSTDPDTLGWLDEQRDAQQVRVVRDDSPFNWSRLSNIGASHARKDVLCFLNNDVEVISPDWARQLAGIALRPEVGATGPLLLYPDDRIQHAGVVVGFGGFADHVYAGATIAQSLESCFVSPLVDRDVAAVTGACLVTSRARFAELGGFDERFEVAGDVDYCLRARSAGYRNIYCGRARLYHHESRTRTKGLPARDRELLGALIEQALPEGDPHFNPNLSLSSRFPLIEAPGIGTSIGLRAG